MAAHQVSESAHFRPALPNAAQRKTPHASLRAPGTRRIRGVRAMAPPLLSWVSTLRGPLGVSDDEAIV